MLKPIDVIPLHHVTLIKFKVKQYQKKKKIQMSLVKI